MEQTSAVKNAADATQVKKARKNVKLVEQQERLDLEWVLKTPQGRRVFWRMLSKAGIYHSIWEPSAKIHYNAGKQDYGLWLLAQLEQSSPDYTLLMMKENRKESENV